MRFSDRRFSIENLSPWGLIPREKKDERGLSLRMRTVGIRNHSIEALFLVLIKKANQQDVIKSYLLTT